VQLHFVEIKKSCILRTTYELLQVIYNYAQKTVNFIYIDMDKWREMMIKRERWAGGCGQLRASA
jgi:hypothetical protein